MDNVPEVALSLRAVLDLLCSKYLVKGYFISMDNLCASLELLKDLLNCNTFSCGTVRQNRSQFPQLFKADKMNQGDSTFTHHYDVMTVLFIDKTKLMS